MKIAFLAPVSLSLLSSQFPFDRKLPDVRWGFPLGASLVIELIKRGHHVSIITGNGAIKGLDIYRSPSCDVYLTPECKRTRWQFFSLFVKEVFWLRRAIKQVCPDVVFAHWTYFHAYAGLTSGYPTLCVAHDSPWRIACVNGGLQAWIKAIYAQLFVFPRLCNLTTVSPYIVGELRRLNRYKRNVKVIPNGLSLKENIERAPIRTEATTVAIVADWSARKNIKTFFRAWSELKKRRPHWRAVVFGNGLDDNAVGKWARHHGISLDGVELRGLQPREAIDKFLVEEADVFCSPSLEESFGMVFVEAMIHGVPCVGGKKSGAVPWVLGEGSAGVLTDVTNHEILSKDIERLMCDYERRRLLSEAGIKRVKEFFDITKVVDLYEQELIALSREER